MIEITLQVPTIALEVSQCEIGVLGQCMLAISATMRLHICFCHEIDAIAVTQVIPAGIVGIMTGAYGVDIVLFHDADIL